MMAALWERQTPVAQFDSDASESSVLTSPDLELCPWPAQSGFNEKLAGLVE